MKSTNRDCIPNLAKRCLRGDFWQVSNSTSQKHHPVFRREIFAFVFSTKFEEELVSCTGNRMVLLVMYLDYTEKNWNWKQRSTFLEHNLRLLTVTMKSHLCSNQKKCCDADSDQRNLPDVEKAFHEKITQVEDCFSYAET